jgi:hypothetical protein
VWLEHVARYGALSPLDDVGVAESGPAVHTLDAVLQRDHFAERGGHLPPEHAAAWDALAAPPGVEHITRDGEVAARLARLDVVEFPAHIVERDGGWLDAFDALGGRLGLVVDDLVQRPPVAVGVPPTTFYWLRALHVHPAFRCHRLGATLLAHALWTLLSDELRVAVCEAFAQELLDAELEAHEQGGGRPRTGTPADADP